MGLKYRKINTVWKRDPDTGIIIDGEYSTPEIMHLSNTAWVWTEKIDGTNIRIVREAGSWSFLGRNANSQIPKLLLEYLENHFKDKKIDDGICLYGEGYGGNIQKPGPRYSKDVGFILFDVLVYSGKQRWWLERSKMKALASELDLNLVPIIGVGTLYGACQKVQNGFLSMVSEDETLEAEGLILHTDPQLFDRGGDRVKTKLKTSDYRKLLKQKEAKLALAEKNKNLGSCI